MVRTLRLKSKQEKLLLVRKGILQVHQGCQMVYFQNKNPNLCKFWSAFDLENVVIFHGHLVYFTDIWDIL
jgi:hypothetical protein